MKIMAKTKRKMKRESIERKREKKKKQDAFIKALKRDYSRNMLFAPYVKFTVNGTVFWSKD